MDWGGMSHVQMVVNHEVVKSALTKNLLLEPLLELQVTSNESRNLFFGTRKNRKTPNTTILVVAVIVRKVEII